VKHKYGFGICTVVCDVTSAVKVCSLGAGLDLGFQRASANKGIILLYVVKNRDNTHCAQYVEYDQARGNVPQEKFANIVAHLGIIFG